MTNRKKEIRNAFKELLMGKTRALFSVFTSRQSSLWEEDLPAINIWAQDESEIEIYTESPRRYLRKLEVTIELYLAGSKRVDDEIDDFTSEIENIIDGEDLFTLEKSIRDIIYVSNSVGQDADNTKQGAVATLKYEVQYFTYAGASSNKLPNLEGIDARWDEVDFTKDKIDLPST